MESEQGILTTFDRRQLLGAGSLILASCGTVGRAVGTPPPKTPKIIDVHCHVFNSKDVPAAEFILNVVAREEEVGLFAVLGAVGVEFLRIAATPSAQDELAHLDIQPFAAPLPESAAQNQFREHVFDALSAVSAAAEASPAPSDDQTHQFRNLGEAETAISPDAAQIGGLGGNPSALALNALAKTYDVPGVLRKPEDVNPFAITPLANPNSAERIAALNTLTDKIVADERAARTGAPQTAVGRYFMLLRIFGSYRSDNVRLLDDTFGFDAPHCDRLYCPAVVDYDVWLGAHSINRSTPLLDQAKAMAAVAKHAPANVLVAGYMAFDPLRAAMDECAGVKDYVTTLGVVARAVEEFGFIGAKLYPPMGFRPWGNSQSRDTYGAKVQELFRRGYFPSGYPLGEALDRALAAFYRYCLTKDIPVLAHCSNSQSSFRNAGLRASPKDWKNALESTIDGMKMRRLRLNLGHFGGVWCHIEQAKPGTDEQRRCSDELPWPGEIIDLIVSADGAAWRYPNLAFDLADIDGMGNESARHELVRYLNTILGSGRRRVRALSRMMYGTDWMFLALGRNYAQFASGISSFATAMGVPVDDLMWRNAAAFLGLKQNAPTAIRLKKFYQGDSDRQACLSRLLV